MTDKKYNTIAIDFDGVIAHYHKWNGVGKFGLPIEGVAEAFAKIKKAGRKIVIHTTRGEIPALKRYLKKHHIPYDYVNHNPQNFSHMNAGKPIAEVYVDDRALSFKGKWDGDFINKILNYKPWHCKENDISSSNVRVSQILLEAQRTHSEKSQVYKKSRWVHGKVMSALFPDGLALKGDKDFSRFAILDLIILKLVRYTQNFSTPHQDSIRDLIVYAAMMEEADCEYCSDVLLKS